MLTGSASKGKYNLYYYYHCVSSCGCRYRANYTNKAFVAELKKFKPHPEVEELYKVIKTNVYKKQTSQQQHAGKQLIDEINKVNERIAKQGNYFYLKTLIQLTISCLSNCILPIYTCDMFFKLIFSV